MQAHFEVLQKLFKVKNTKISNKITAIKPPKMLFNPKNIGDHNKFKIN